MVTHDGLGFRVRPAPGWWYIVAETRQVARLAHAVHPARGVRTMTERTDPPSPTNETNTVKTLKRLPTSILDFGRLREGGYYYVDKTMFLPLLEDMSPHLVSTRPRRFGKSLWLSVLEHYYDVRYAAEFDSLFGGLAIAKAPTEERSSYHVLTLDFSGVGAATTPAELERRFA